MPTAPSRNLEPKLRDALTAVRADAVLSFRRLLRGKGATTASRAFARQLEKTRASPHLMRELLLSHVLHDEAESESARSLRRLCGWTARTRTFDALTPEFLNLVYLLPPRDDAIIETLTLLTKHGKKRRPLRLLDVGTGTGLLLRILRKAGYKAQVTGIDPARSLLDHASRALSDERIFTFMPAAIETSSLLPNHYDAVLCYMVLHHVCDAGDYRAALRKLFEALKPDGQLIYVDRFWDAQPGADRDSHGLVFPRSPLQIDLESGQELLLLPREFSAVQPFRPHPADIPERRRSWQQAAKTLSQRGFLVREVMPLNRAIILFRCQKPRVKQWKAFSEDGPKTTAPFLDAKAVQTCYAVARSAPYQWLFDALKALYTDISGDKCPERGQEATGFLRGIAYFSWEQPSRLFLVRRAVPFDFHILSYSHVHDGWGSLGRMVEEFERSPTAYVRKRGYSCLTTDSVQRTLPFQGDIKALGYRAAMAVPVCRPETHELRGALLLFLAREWDVPLHTGGPLHTGLVRNFRRLSDRISGALDAHEEQLRIVNMTQQIATQWRKLAKSDSTRPAIVAQLTLVFSEKSPPRKLRSAGGKLARREAKDVCSNIQAALSGRDCFPVLARGPHSAGRAVIFVAGRNGLLYEDIRERVLAAVGPAAETCRSFSYSCEQLGASDDAVT